MDSCKGTKPENIAKARKMILDAQPAKGSLILLPEMFATGYLPANIDDAAEDFSSQNAGETARMLSEVAEATHCTIMGAGITRDSRKFLNHVSIYTPGSTNEFSSYDKTKLFFPERDLFESGKSINLFKINGFKIATFICFDLRFPELFREATKQGANLITVQAAWPAKRHTHWETLLKARAIENQIYIAAVNAVSTNINSEKPLAGTSLIIAPNGDILAEGPAQSEAVISAELDLQAEKDYRKSFPVLEGLISLD